MQDIFHLSIEVIQKSIQQGADGLNQHYLQINVHLMTNNGTCNWVNDSQVHVSNHQIKPYIEESQDEKIDTIIQQGDARQSK